MLCTDLGLSDENSGHLPLAYMHCISVAPVGYLPLSLMLPDFCLTVSKSVKLASVSVMQAVVQFAKQAYSLLVTNHCHHANVLPLEFGTRHEHAL